MENERRLIDADVLAAHFRKTKVIEVFPNWEELPPNVTSAVIRFAKKWREIVLSAPTVHAVEVVHGRWKKAYIAGYLKCNCCEDAFIYEEWLESGKWNYCPNCGAKMDGDGNA